MTRTKSSLRAYLHLCLELATRGVVALCRRPSWAVAPDPDTVLTQGMLLVIGVCAMFASIVCQ